MANSSRDSSLVNGEGGQLGKTSFDGSAGLSVVFSSPVLIVEGFVGVYEPLCVEHGRLVVERRQRILDIRVQKLERGRSRLPFLLV